MMAERRWATIGWYALIGFLAILPTFTWLENVPVMVGSLELHGRFILHAAAAAVVTVCAAFVVVGSRMGRWWMAPGAAWLSWLLITAVLAAQPVRESLPTVMRWSLYLASLLVAYRYGMQSRDPRAALVQVVGAVVIGAIPALAAGLIEAATGNAPILNNAPRVTGTMPLHPVAFSLVLGVALLLALSILEATKTWWRIGLAVFSVAAFVGIMFTYTRATMLMVPPAAAAILTLGADKWRWRRAATTSMAAVLVVGLTLPFVAARVGEDRPMEVQVPAASREAGEPGSAPVPIDNSTGLRLETFLFGMEYLKASPLIGHGPGSFDRLFFEDTGKEEVAAHNDLLQTAVETGVVGLTILLILFGVVLYLLYRARQSEIGILRITATATAVAFIAVNIVGTIHNPAYFPEVQLPLWVAAGGVLGLANRHREA